LYLTTKITFILENLGIWLCSIKDALYHLHIIFMDILLSAEGTSKEEAADLSTHEYVIFSFPRDFNGLNMVRTFSS